MKEQAPSIQNSELSTETSDEMLENEIVDVNNDVGELNVEVQKGTDNTLNLTPDEVMKVLEKVQQLEQENVRLKDRVLREKAELENTRKRLMRHYEDTSREKVKQLLLDVIELLDNFNRALDASNTPSNDEDSKIDDNSILEGIKIIENQFVQTLQTKWNVCRFDSLNDDFDPEKHEAMMRELTSQVQVPTVTEEFSKGYLFDDKLLRPAKVKVALPE